jgi:arginyl-tRNA synthetase
MIREELTALIESALRQAAEARDIEEFQGALRLERPPSEDLGDYATPVAMSLARQTGRPPREVAQALVRHIESIVGADLASGGASAGSASPLECGTAPPRAESRGGLRLIEKVEVADPGFINFRVSPARLQDVVRQVLERGEMYGRSDKFAGKKVDIEFVSANPTGPLLVVNGRAAAFGDVLASLMQAVGWQVTREYYINDATTSSQIERLGESVEARYMQALGLEAQIPEEGYQGEYIVEMGKELAEREGDRYLKLPAEERAAVFAQLTLDRMLEDQKRSLEQFGVRIDVWFRESSLFENGKVQQTLSLLKERGFAYEAEDALWVRSSLFGDEKDRVLVRGTGKEAYLGTDLAYHRDKFQRGYDLLIDVWGPDHHGHAPRVLAGIEAMGFNRQAIQIVIHQLVRLVSGGEQVRMSKRMGNVVPLDDLVSEVGRDAARFFFLTRSADTPLDFDLELAKKQSLENPVYYVQYAHARICSILQEARARGVPIPQAAPREAQGPPDSSQGMAAPDLSLLSHPRELALMRTMADLPHEIMAAAEGREPHRLTRYAQDMAAAFHIFYTECRVLSQDPDLTAARLCLVLAVHAALRTVLAALGISAPESM